MKVSLKQTKTDIKYSDLNPGQLFKFSTNGSQAVNIKSYQGYMYLWGSFFHWTNPPNFMDVPVEIIADGIVFEE